MGEWRVRLSCCGRDAGVYEAGSWAEADAFRESWTSGQAVDPHGYSGDGHSGHQRAGIIERAMSDAEAQAGGVLWEGLLDDGALGRRLQRFRYTQTHDGRVWRSRHVPPNTASHGGWTEPEPLGWTDSALVVHTVAGLRAAEQRVAQLTEERDAALEGARQAAEVAHHLPVAGRLVDRLMLWKRGLQEVAEQAEERARVAEARAALLEQQWRDFEEREAACCPEDVPFDAYVAILSGMVDDERAAKLEAEARAARERELWREYATLLADGFNSIWALAVSHGWKYPDAKYQRGVELRAALGISGSENRHRDAQAAAGADEKGGEG